MPSEGHDVTQFALPCPPADGFGGDMKQGGRFSGSQVSPGSARSMILRRVGNATQLRHLHVSHRCHIGCRRFDLRNTGGLRHVARSPSLL